MRTPAELRAGAARAGMRLESYEIVPTPDGRMTIAGTIRFKDPWDAARYLVAETATDASDPVVRQYALSILAACREALSEPGPTRSPELLACTAAAIQQNVQHWFGFVHERVETFQSARETIELGNGDCDDLARLAAALGLAANIPGTELVFFDEQGIEVSGRAIQARKGKPEPIHVTPKLAGEYAETTIAAAFGENPFDALDRLEIETGENPMAHAPEGDGLGSLRDDVVATQTRVADQSTRLAVVVEGCKDLDAATSASWDVLARRALAYASTDPSDATVEDGNAILRDMNAFGDTLRAKGCSSTPPPVPVPSNQPSDLGGQNPLALVGSAVKTVAIAAGVVAVALTVREVARASRSRRRAVA